ncbi:MAG: DNA topoisomerase [Coriobacteriaceae bacterium]|nr:DNA topoisomerase [Coriobacteriaceae bacterium]
MKLVVSEKNIAAERIAAILAVGKPEKAKVHSTPAYTFRRDGEDWVSIGLKGHIMKVDFPEEFGKWKLDQVRDLVMAPVLKLDAEKGIIQSLRSLAKKADSVIIATDFDREGELIGADARDIVLSANPSLPVSRVRFSAITKGEIERAFAEPDVISDALAQAGETRQDIDLIWGAVLTRLMTLMGQKRAFGDVISAGRVQTPTLKLIVDRECEREAFVPEDYWVVKAAFAEGEERFAAGHAVERFRIEAEAHAVMTAVAHATTGTVVEVKTTGRQVPAPAPFNTTSLMAAASSEGMTPAQTMRVAESLYIGGYLSYPRVDNTVYPPSLEIAPILRALREVPQYAEYAGKLLAKGTLTPTRGSKEATDHPPIHPTGPADPEKLDPQGWKLYNLVARRFMATLSEPAVVEGTRVEIAVASERFIAKGDVIAKPGFREIYPYGLKKDEHLPSLTQGETVAFHGAELEAKQTQPPSRYSQGKLIQEMEKLGLGTKATRHDIIQGLYERKYVEQDPVEPTCKGRTVVDALSTHAERITTPGMTRDLEAEMDDIANARAERATVVGHSRRLLAEVVEALLGHAPELGEKLKVAADQDARLGSSCPVSGHDLLFKYSPKNKSHFVGCAGFPDCTVTYPLPKMAKFEGMAEPCAICGTPQVLVKKFKSKARVMCLSPDCPTKKGPEISLGPCTATGCSGELRVLYSAVASRYVRCTEYETCKTSYPLPQSGEIESTGERCEPCGSPVVVIHNKKGPWRICIDPACSAKEQGKKSSRKPAKGVAKGGRKKSGRASS